MPPKGTNRRDAWPLDDAVAIDGENNLAPVEQLLGRPRGLVEVDAEGQVVPLPSGIDTSSADDFCELDDEDQVIPRE